MSDKKNSRETDDGGKRVKEREKEKTNDVLQGVVRQIHTVACRVVAKQQQQKKKKKRRWG